MAIAGGPATLTNTDTISIDAGGGTDRVTVDESDGLFAPGLTPEATGTSEIEITVVFGTGPTMLRLLGQDGAADSIDGSASFLNVDGDDDIDDVAAFYSAFGGDDRWELDGGGGDTIQGGSGVDTIDGGLDNDHILGGTQGDTITGGTGPTS